MKEKGVHTFPQSISLIENAKAILLKEQKWYYLIYNMEDKGVHTFPKSISLIENVKAILLKDQ